jgi:outer membrane receptor protein involved in Fe transport
VDPGYKWYALRPNDSRGSAFAHFKYDFADDRSAFIQLLKGKHAVETLPAPTGFAPGWSTTLFRDNPYLPASIVDRMNTAGVTSVPFNRIFEDLATAREIEDEITSVTLGFDGDIGHDLFLSAYYQRGQNIEIADYSSNGLLVRTDRFYRALDSAIDPATGRIACRANIPAYGALTPEQEAAITRISALGQPVSGDPESNRQCVPMNPLATHLPQEVIDYVTGGVHHRQKIRQDVFDVSVQTTLGEGGAREPISLGGGLTYREESVFQDAMGNADDPRRMQDFGVFSSFLSPSDQIPIRGIPTFIRDRGIFYTGNPNNEGPIQGKFDVWEAFVESIVPVFRSGTQSADLHLAARYSSYTGSGGVWAGKIGGDWQLNEQIRLRATLSRDTRAGSLSERFDTQTGGTNITDPLLPNEPPYIAATTIGGNPDIKPELSDTFTAGFVYQPEWLEGLSLSADYYDISIKDAISQLGGAQIVDRCYLQGATELCGLITRSAVGTPYISQIFNLYINVAETTTAGVDLEASYRQQIDLLGGSGESIAVRVFGNYLDEVTSAFVGERVINEAGEINYSKWLATASLTYANGPFSVNFQTRYIGKSIRDVLWVEGIDIEDNSVDSRLYTNMNLAYDFEFGDGHSGEAYFYVGNLFDKDPPLVPGGIGVTTGTATHTNNGLFDTLGRTYSAGVRMRFE